MRNRDKLLGLASIITGLIGSANALEVFLAGKTYLNKIVGTVERVSHENYDGRKNILYSKSTLYIKGKNKKYFLSEKSDDGGYIDVKEGDSVVLYTRKWYQSLYNYNFASNIYYAENSSGELYNNLLQWKGPAFYYMCVFGGAAIFLIIMYLDQVKNISITNWFQKNVINRKKS